MMEVHLSHLEGDVVGLEEVDEVGLGLFALLFQSSKRFLNVGDFARELLYAISVTFTRLLHRVLNKTKGRTEGKLHAQSSKRIEIASGSNRGRFILQ